MSSRFVPAALRLLASAPVCLAVTARAEITDLRASAEAHVSEFRADATAGEESAFDAFPDTSDLPLAVLAYVSSRPDYPAGGSAGAAVSDPASSKQSNPGEFALNLSLNTASAAVRFEGRSFVREDRNIVLAPADVGGKAAGSRVTVTGRLFLDGVLALYSSIPGADLSGNHATWQVRVTQKSAAGIEAVAFDGTLELSGLPGGSAEIRESGSFPKERITLATGPTADSPFPAFNIAVVPAISVDYTYDAIVGEPFTLTATMELAGVGTPGANGITAIVGAPVQSLQTIVNATFGEPAGAALARAVAREREAPRGAPAFAANPALPGACGLLGVESLLLSVAALGAHSLRRRPGRRR